MMKLAVSGLYRAFFRTVVLLRIRFDAWCAAYGRTRNVQMTIGNTNAKIVNRMTTLWVVDAQSQDPYMIGTKPPYMDKLLLCF